MNNFVGVGRLVKDVELREVNNSKVANFSIAITRQYKNSNGEYETDFINCKSWGQVAEKIKEYCNKGDMIGVGRLVKDVELREVNNGKVANFSIAITRQYKNSNGEYETDFINCRSWGQVGEKIKEYCNKGDMIGVKGSIRNDVYQDKDGNKKSSIYVNVERVTFLSSKKINNGLPEETEVPF